MTKIRKVGESVLLLLAVLATARSQGQHDPGYLHKYGPNGLRILEDHTAMVLAARGGTAGLWRVEADNDQFIWTQVVLPDALSVKLARDFKGTGSVQIDPDGFEDELDLEVQGDQPRLLWFEDRPQSEAEFERRGSFPFFLVQASSTNRGANWTLSRSAFRFNPELDSVDDYVAVDAQHAWLLASGEPGAGQSPQALFTTADAGAHWAKVQDWNEQKDRMPIGGNSPQLLHVTDAGHAWFIAICANCDDSYVLNAAYTLDGGRTWKRVPLSLDYPCKHCQPSGLQENRALADGCFTTGLTESISMNYCSTDGGHTWSKPMAGSAVVSRSVLRPAAPRCCGTGVAFARDEPMLGVSNVCADAPPDKYHAAKWWRCDLLLTRDGGRTFVEALPQLNVYSSLTLETFAAKGKDAWMIVKFPDASVNKLFHSGDHGASWRVVDPQGAP